MCALPVHKQGLNPRNPDSRIQAPRPNQRDRKESITCGIPPGEESAMPGMLGSCRQGPGEKTAHMEQVQTIRVALTCHDQKGGYPGS